MIQLKVNVVESKAEGGTGIIGMERRIGGCGQISWCSSHGK